MDAHTNARDRSALQALDKVLIESTGMGMPFEKMLERVLGASDACEDECSPEVHAKLWMYAGIVLGSGRNDIEGARCAFEIAHAWDPKIVLDEALCTDAVKVAFAGARHQVCGK